MVVAVLAWFVANIIHLKTEGDEPVYFIKIGEWSTLSFQTVVLGIVILVLVIKGVQTLVRRHKK